MHSSTPPFHHDHPQPSDACINLYCVLEELVSRITEAVPPDDDIPFIIAFIHGGGVNVCPVTSGDKDAAFNALALTSLAAPDAVGFASYAWHTAAATRDRVRLRPSQHPARQESAHVLAADGHVLLQGTASVSRLHDKRPMLAGFDRSSDLLSEAGGVIPDIIRAGYCFLGREVA